MLKQPPHLSQLDTYLNITSEKFYLFMQNKKTWKQISHIRKNSTDSLNESFESNSKSTNSQKFNRFNFQNDIDGNPKPRKAHPSRDHLHDISVMSKRSNKSTDKKANFFNHDFLFKMGK